MNYSTLIVSASVKLYALSFDLKFQFNQMSVNLKRVINQRQLKPRRHSAGIIKISHREIITKFASKH